MLNILNGQALYDYFKSHHLDNNGIYVPFNEAMCVGEADADIFSGRFIERRCSAHHVSEKEYEKITLKPLQPLFENNFKDIVLWFDDDMFCQINLLTLLAYLDQINYRRKVIFNLVSRGFKQGFRTIDSFELEVKEYREKYKQVMINKHTPENISMPVMENGIRLYMEYIKDENEITKFINQHIELDDYDLMLELLKAFPQYGLGDTQYMQLIKKYGKKI